MHVKELFESIVNYQYKLKALNEELVRVRLDIESVSAVKLTEKVQSSNQSDMSMLLERLESYKLKVLSMQFDLISRKNLALEVIEYETDNLTYSILLWWYICGYSWDQIIDIVGNDRSTLNERKNKAVCRLEQIVPQSTLQIPTNPYKSLQNPTKPYIEM